MEWILISGIGYTLAASFSNNQILMVDTKQLKPLNPPLWLAMVILTELMDGLLITKS